MLCLGRGVDYNSGPYVVHFNTGVTSVTITVLLNDDNILENNETFNLRVDPSSLPVSVTVSNSNTATVTILDNDGKHKYVM